jgi:hypothetical protein
VHADSMGSERPRIGAIATVCQFVTASDWVSHYEPQCQFGTTGRKYKFRAGTIRAAVAMNARGQKRRLQRSSEHEVKLLRILFLIFYGGFRLSLGRVGQRGCEGTGFSQSALFEFSLLAALGLIALFFEPLHFLLALLKGDSGHGISFENGVSNKKVQITSEARGVGARLHCSFRARIRCDRTRDHLRHRRAERIVPPWGALRSL